MILCDEICDVIKYFTLILLQFEIICVYGHPGRTYMSSWFCYAKIGCDTSRRNGGQNLKEELLGKLPK